MALTTNDSNFEAVSKNISDFQRARDYWQPWIDRAEESYQFVRGVQWNQEDVDFLEEQGRPHFTYNIILPTINAASGTMRLNKFNTIYSPRKDADVKTATLLTKLGKHIDSNSNKQFLGPEVFIDGLITGVGWYGADVSFENNPFGDIVINKENPLMMFMDPNCRNMDLSDCNWIIKTAYLTKEQMKMVYGNRTNEIDNLSISRFFNFTEHADINDRLNINNVNKDFFDELNDAFLVLEKWFWKVVPKDILFNMDTRVTVIKGTEEAKKLPPGNWVEFRKNIKELWIRSTVLDVMLQERRYDWPIRRMPFAAFFHDRLQRDHFGI